MTADDPRESIAAGDPGSLHAFVTRLPKAELHMHLEGSLEPDLIFTMARRNGVTLAHPDATSLREAYEFNDLAEFLAVYYEGLRVLITECDFYDMTHDYLRRAHADGIVNAELFVSPQSHIGRGIPLAAMFGGIGRAIEDARETLAISAGLILGIQRQYTEAEAFDMVEQVAPWGDQVLGIGLGGPERGNPPAKFARVFAECRARGWRAVAHAGEEGEARNVAEAVDVLQVDRVDHGVRCEDDPELVARLADRGIPLTVCPVSNVKLKVFDSLARHNCRRLLEAGIKVTLNSDDPSYFGAYLVDNFVQTATALGLTRGHLRLLARNSIEASFMDSARRSDYLAQIDRS